MSSHLIEVSVKLDRQGDFHKVLSPFHVDDDGLKDVMAAYGLHDDRHAILHGMYSYYSQDHVYPLVRLLVLPEAQAEGSEAGEPNRGRDPAPARYPFFPRFRLDQR